jgi:hypothetical protein
VRGLKRVHGAALARLGQLGRTVATELRPVHSSISAPAQAPIQFAPLLLSTTDVQRAT